MLRNNNDIPDNEFTPICIDPESNDFIDTPNNSVVVVDQESGFSIFKNLSKLSLPMALSYTFSIEVFIATVLLSVIAKSDDQLAAIALVATTMNTIPIIGMSILMGMGIVMSGLIGELDENDEEQLADKRNQISQINISAQFVSCVTTPLVIAGLVFSKELLMDVFKQPEAVAALAASFLKIYSIAIPGLMVRMSSEAIMFSFKKGVPAMVIGLSSLAVGSGLAVWMGLGGGPMPKLGAPGVAAGFVVEAYITAAGYSLYVLLARDFKNYQFFNFKNNIHLTGKHLKALLRVGLPITAAVTTELAASVSVGVLAGLIGTTEQSATSAIMKIMFFNFILSAAFGTGCAQEMSRLTGANEHARIRRFGKFGLLTTLVYTSPAPIIFGAAPSLLVILDNVRSANISDILKVLAPIMSAGIIADSWRFNILSQLRGMGDNGIPMVITVSGVGAGLLISSLLALKSQLGVYGIAVGYVAGNALSGSALSIRWLQQLRRMDNIDNQPLFESAKPKKRQWLTFFKCCHQKSELDSELRDNHERQANIL